MAQFPALPLFTDAYMADTRHLTAAQHGAYLLLLMTAWRMPDCKLPDDDKFLARCVAMDLRSWKANRDIVMSFWKRDSEHKWYQARLLDERKYVEDKRNKNAKNAKARWLNNKDSSNANALPNRCQIDAPTPTPTPTPIKKEKNIKKKVQISLGDLSVDHIKDWLAGKRIEGKYINHDEYHILEVFKNYCESKGVKYDNYIAAYRNAFEWKQFQPSQQSYFASRPTIHDNITLGIQQFLSEHGNE